MIRVLIAEDQAMVLGALAALLGTEPDIEVVAQAADGRDALSQALDLQPDIVLTDIEMPRMTGLELAAELARQDRSIRVIVLTTFGRPGYLRRALDAGAAGYLLKDAPSASLANAIRTVHAGGRAIDPDLAAQAWTGPDPLTDRQRQALRLAADGRSGPEIAAALRLSEGTVPQLPVGGDLPPGGAEPGRGGASRPQQGMALMRSRRTWKRRASRLLRDAGHDSARGP